MFLQIRRTNSGGRAGKGKNKTASIQVVDCYAFGYSKLEKQYRYTIGDKKSEESALKKAKDYIKKEKK